MLGVRILIVIIELACGCAPPSYSYYPSWNYNPPAATPDTDTDTRQGKIEKGRFAGFPLPPKLEDKWANFLDRYNKDQIMEVHRNLTSQEQIDDERTSGFGWPESWKGLNFGDRGLKDIPPWAWEPVNDEGLPTYCFLPLDQGNSTGIGDEVCTEEERIAYNPFIKNCIPFTYFGCGGNTNNFVRLELCTEQCMPHPKQGGCDPNVMQLISTLSDLDEEWGENP